MKTLRERLHDGSLDDSLSRIYGADEQTLKKKRDELAALVDKFGDVAKDLKPSLYTAAGRSELGGNHTDHQHGNVLAAAVTMETIACAGLNGTGTVRVLSEQYPEDVVELDDLDPKPEEEGRSVAIVRGIIRAIVDRGYHVDGVTIFTQSGVPGGSGLSSSAAFEILIGNVLNHLFCDDQLTPVELAQIGQFAENVYFGKPSGLLDQMACSVGGIIGIDFGDPEAPLITALDYDLADSGYALCIIDSGADHADLTDEYAAVASEMTAVANFFDQPYLRAVDPEDFWKNLPAIREQLGDRPAARAAHFFGDDRRVPQQIAALQRGDFDAFLKMVRESGESSGIFLQNVRAESSADQSVVLTMALAMFLLDGRGAVRVHGGGFAGTVQAYVPAADADEFRDAVDAVLGEGSCAVLQVRPVGGAFIAE